MSTRGRSSTQTAIAIAASACSLGAIVFLGVGSLGRDAQATIERPTPAVLPSALPSAPAALPDRSDSAAKSQPTPSSIPAALPPAPGPTADAKHSDEADEADLVTVPDVSGERLWIARKHLREVGLVLAPRDEGRMVPTQDYGMYAVGPAPILGTRVPAGTKVEVEIEYWSPSWGRGY